MSKPLLNSLEILKDIKNIKGKCGGRGKKNERKEKKKKMQEPSGYTFLKTLKALNNCDIRVKILVFSVLKERCLFIRI